MLSAESRVSKRESSPIVHQAAPVAPSLSAQPPTSHAFIDPNNLIINGGQFNHIFGNHTVININREESPDDSLSSTPPLKEIHNISLAQLSDQLSDSENRTRMKADHENLKDQSQISSRSHKIPFQKSNDIYERHLTQKGRGFPLWIPDPNRALPLGYRRTGVRIGDVGIITHSGAFSFLFNICLPHNDPVNPRVLPDHFAPISPPIEATDIENYIVFKNGSHLSSASVKRSQTSTTISDIVFESSASEGAILTLPRGARSEDLGNLARFREYAADNVTNWYRFVNGARGREAKNGDVRLVVGFDKTTSWGIATFANETQQNSCLLKFGPSEGDSASNYTWSEYSGVADVRAGPDSDEIDELRIDSDPPDVQFENQCLFVRTLNVTLADDVWADIHSNSGSLHPRVKNHSDSNRPHSTRNNPGNGSNFPPPSQGEPSGAKKLQSINITSDKDRPIFVSGLVESPVHPSKVLNDNLLAKIPTAKMVITHDDDWSSVSEYDPHDLVENVLALRDIYQENDVVFLQLKKEISEGSTSGNRAQVPEAAVMQDSPLHYTSPLDPNKPIKESFRYDRGVNEHTAQDDEQHKRPTTTATNAPSISVSRPLPVSPAQGTSYVNVMENRPPPTQFTDHNSPPLNRTPSNPTLYAMRKAPTLIGKSASFQASGSHPSRSRGPSFIASNTRATLTPSTNDTAGTIMKLSSFFRGELTENHDVGQSDIIVIVVIGQTAAGKSSFINIAADKTLKVSNTSLTSCTKEFAYVRCTSENSREVVFVDTIACPTYGYANPSQEEKVGYDISKWIKAALGKHVKVSRILYLRDISIIRWVDQPPPYGIFRTLCGPQYSASVALVFTKCENASPTTYQERMKYLTVGWKQLMGERAAVYSHNGTKQSAWEVVAGLGVI